MQLKKKMKQLIDQLDLESSEQAFNALKAEIEAVPSDALLPVNVDVAVAAMIAIRAAPRLEVLMTEFGTEKLMETGFDPTNVTRLRLYAAAAWHAHVMATPANDGKLQFQIGEATKLKKSLLLWADALADRGLLSAERIAEIRAGTGHVDLANDMVALGQMFGDAWATIEDKCAISKDEVDRAKVLGLEILVGLGAKREGGDEASLRTKVKAFTLFAKAYDQCRRVVGYLRWDVGDQDLIAPSIYVRKRRRNGEDEPEVVEPEEPVVTPGLDGSTPLPTPEGPAVPELPFVD